MLLPGDPKTHVAEELAAKTWAELEVLEHDGHLLFPDRILKRKRDGSFEAVKVMLRVPREHQRRAARRKAKEWAATEKIDPLMDGQQFDNMLTVCELTDAIRNTTPPHEQWVMSPEELEKTYDSASLAQLYGKLDSYARLLDPKTEEFDEETFLALVAALVKEGGIRPLHVLDGRSQSDFIVSMASRLQAFLTPKS